MHIAMLLETESNIISYAYVIGAAYAVLQDIKEKMEILEEFGV